jgi:hypothetical protein
MRKIFILENEKKDREKKIEELLRNLELYARKQELSEDGKKNIDWGKGLDVL